VAAIAPVVPEKLPPRPCVVDSVRLALVMAALVGWLEGEQRDVIEFLREENRVLKAQLRGRRMRLIDDDRHRRRQLFDGFGEEESLPVR